VIQAIGDWKANCIIVPLRKFLCCKEFMATIAETKLIDKVSASNNVDFQYSEMYDDVDSNVKNFYSNYLFVLLFRRIPRMLSKNINISNLDFDLANLILGLNSIKSIVIRVDQTNVFLCGHIILLNHD
jgi:hypothetical protein